MPSVQKRPRPAKRDATVRETLGDALMQLLVLGCEYVHEHPKARARGRPAEEAMIRRLLLDEDDAEDDAEGER